MLRNATIVMVNSKQYKVLQCINGVITEQKALEVLKLNKPLYFIIHGEEINIRKLMLPKCRASGIPIMIEQEFSYEFNDLSNILSCYEEINKRPNIIELFVYYFKIDRMPIVREYLTFSNHKIKGIFSLQFIILNHYRKELKQKDYLLLYKDAEILLLAWVVKDLLIKSHIADINKSKEDQKEEVYEFIKDVYYKHNKTSKFEIYYSAENENFSDEYISTDVSKYCDFIKLKYKGFLEMTKRQL